MIGVDWGTTSLRAYRLDAAGGVLEARESAQGILSVPKGGFPSVLDAVVRPWLDAGEELVLLCGMIGSRQGWREAPYLSCPAGPSEIAAATVPLPFSGASRCFLVPGLSTRGPEGVPDVMRGEETKLLGVMAETGEAAEATLCLPGTHSKWARLSAGRIAGFATQMTGETFAALSEHTILARTGTEGPTVPEAFARGVRRSGEAGGLLHHLFGTRTLGLMGELAATETRSYLSGLLIGHEIRAALAAPRETPAGSVHLLASARLEALYADAFGILGVPHRRHDPDTVARGLALIGRSLG
jgi:2-dehydro-3-deoxygalactonokinase